MVNQRVEECAKIMIKTTNSFCLEGVLGSKMSNHPEFCCSESLT